MTRHRLAWVVAAATVSLLPIVPTASAAPPPCTGPASSDEWPTFGRDLANTRHQEEPGDIAPATAPTLQPVWSYTTGNDFAGTGDLNGTPIVSAGCVFLNTAAGDVIALDSATGRQVWRTRIALDPGTVPGLGGIFVSSPAVADGVVLALVSQLGSPYVVGLRAKDGKVLWRSEPIVSGEGFYTNATAVVSHGLLLAGFSPAEGDPTARGGITLFDAATGALVERVYAIPDAAFDAGYAGAGIWTAPAVDSDGYAYAGTGNPFSKKIEHENTNAIIKIDIDRSRATFGTVVGSLKGLIEQYRQEVRDAVDPTCEALGEDPNLQLIVGDSAPCLQLDQDFGAPPSLFTDSDGTQLIGDLQKAGVFHVARTDTMERAWDQIVGVTCPACNAAAWAFDAANGQLVGASSPGGTTVAIDADDGAHRWASPIGDGTHYQSTSLAGGVAFTVDNLGNLLAWEAATGVPLLRRPMQVDVPDGMAPGLTSSGVAIASGMVIAAVGNAVVAYAPLG